MKNKTITLREARLKAGLTQKELADKAGLTWATLQAIEMGRTPGSFMAKYKLVDALGLTLKELWPETYAEMSALLATGFGKAKRAK